MRAKVVVFPIRGRNWCFSRSIDPSASTSQFSNAPSTVKELFSRIFSSSSSSSSDHKKNPSDDYSKVELTIDFVSNKMNGAWSNLEKAPQGTVKNKIHGLGLKLLSRVKPSEIFFKSIPKEISGVEIVYPPSLNPRLVRRRLRHMASRGSAIHKKYFYGSAMLLPLTSFFMFLPLPNIPFFWVLFRTYSHWRASQGSEKLLHLVSDASCNPQQSREMGQVRGESRNHNSDQQGSGIRSNSPSWVFQSSKELEKLMEYVDVENGLSECALSKICNKFHLNPTDVAKYRNSTSM